MSLLNEIAYRFFGNRYRIKLLQKKGVTIGNYCSIEGNCSFGSEPYLITIGDNVKITNGVSFVTHDGGVYVLRKYKNIPDADIFGTIKIGNNVFIGNKAVVMPGVRIGDNCIIGYGAIITKNIPEGSVAVGVPAKVIKTIDEYYDGVSERIVNTKSFSYEEKKKFLNDYYIK